MAMRNADDRDLYRTALITMRERDDRNGSVPKAYREIIDAALSPSRSKDASKWHETR